MYPHGDHLTSDDLLKRLGHPAKRIVMNTPYFTSAPLLVSGTDNLILLPLRLGETLTRAAPVVLIALHADTDFEYRRIWHERTQKDQGRSWIRTQIYNLFAIPNRTTTAPTLKEELRASKTRRLRPKLGISLNAASTVRLRSRLIASERQLTRSVLRGQSDLRKAEAFYPVTASSCS
jgi:hypothetical protein